VGFGVYVQSGSTDEAETGVVVVIVGPIVYCGALRGQAVPVVDVERKQPRHKTCPVAEIVPAHLPVMIR
jgi:hypothetical protein